MIKRFLCAFFFLAFGVTFAAELAEKPRLAVFGFLNQTGDDSFTIPAETASSNLLITMKTLNLFQVTDTETIPRSLTDANLEQWCARNKIDFIIFGTITKRSDEKQDYQIAYFSRSEKKITDKKNEMGESVRDVFSVLDTLVDSMLETITKSKVSFGSLQFSNTGVSGDYDVFLDDIFIQTNPATFERIPSGNHSVRVVHKATEKDLAVQQVAIKQGKTDTVQFEIKELTEEDKALVASKKTEEEAEPEVKAGGTYQQGLLDGEKESKGHPVGYFISGCCLGAIGIIIPAVNEPEVPGQFTVGKSTEYIQGFRESYKAKTKSKNIKSAVFGLATTCGVTIILYVALIMSVY